MQVRGPGHGARAGDLQIERERNGIRQGVDGSAVSAPAQALDAFDGLDVALTLSGHREVDQVGLAVPDDRAGLLEIAGRHRRRAIVLDEAHRHLVRLLGHQQEPARGLDGILIGFRLRIRRRIGIRVGRRLGIGILPLLARRRIRHVIAGVEGLDGRVELGEYGVDHRLGGAFDDSGLLGGGDGVLQRLPGLIGLLALLDRLGGIDRLIERRLVDGRRGRLRLRLGKPRGIHRHRESDAVGEHACHSAADVELRGDRLVKRAHDERVGLVRRLLDGLPVVFDLLDGIAVLDERDDHIEGAVFVLGDLDLIAEVIRQHVLRYRSHAAQIGGTLPGHTRRIRFAVQIVARFRRHRDGRSGSAGARLHERDRGDRSHRQRRRQHHGSSALGERRRGEHLP